MYELEEIESARDFEGLEVEFGSADEVKVFYRSLRDSRARTRCVLSNAVRRFDRSHCLMKLWSLMVKQSPGIVDVCKLM